MNDVASASGPAATGAPEPAIVASSLTRKFRELVAVDRLDLSVPAGSFQGLLGSNGAGKTTTIKILTTLLLPTAGRATVAGFDVVSQPSEVRRRIGYVPQLLSADAALTGFENLMLSAKLYAIARSERRERIEHALAMMGLADAARRVVRTYSGGMIRRLEIAQAMLHRPPVLILDEPTVGLDPVARHAVWDRLRELRAQLGTTMLLTTHDMEEAGELCETLVILHAGRVVARGSPRELREAIGPEATLDDVFIRATGGALDQGGGYRDAARTRSTAHRLG